MIKEFFLSFKDTLKTKTTNPFLGTLIIVWFFHNWELLYTIFNFEPTYTLSDKIGFIWLYLTPVNFIPNLLRCILDAFLVLIATYVLLNLSRAITNSFENIITPWVYKFTAPRKIVLISQLEKIQSERDFYVTKFSKEREERLILQKQLDELENSKSKKTNKQNENDVLNEVRKNETIYNHILEIKLDSVFSQVIEIIGSRQSLNKINANHIKEFVKLGLMEKKPSGVYNFTPFGNSFKEFFTFKML